MLAVGIVYTVQSTLFVMPVQRGTAGAVTLLFYSYPLIVTLLFAGLRLLGPSRTAVVMTLEAFFAIVLAAITLDETLGPLQIAGGAVVLGGALIVAASAPRRTPPADPAAH